MECHPEQANQYTEAWKTKESRTEYRTALIRMTIAQCLVGKKKNGRPFKLDEFLPDYCKPKKLTKTLDEQADDIERMFAEFIVK